MAKRPKAAWKQAYRDKLAGMSLRELIKETLDCTARELINDVDEFYAEAAEEAMWAKLDAMEKRLQVIDFMRVRPKPKATP